MKLAEELQKRVLQLEAEREDLNALVRLLIASTPAPETTDEVVYIPTPAVSLTFSVTSSRMSRSRNVGLPVTSSGGSERPAH